MTSPDVPTFDEWVEYAFTQGYADFKGDYDETKDHVERFVDFLPARTVAEYLARLFSDPAFLIDRYSPKQIADATWFLFGCASDYWKVVRQDGVPDEQQVRCVESVSTMYTELFDKLCMQESCRPDSRWPAIDVAVLMIWDMGMDSPILGPEDYPHLVEPSLHVLETALLKCQAPACWESAFLVLGDPRFLKSAHELIRRFAGTSHGSAYLKSRKTLGDA